MYKGEILAILDETPTVKRFFIKIISDTKYDFLPGQFVMLYLPIHHQFATRSYSIANSPNDENIVELCIVQKPDGEGSTFLFQNIHKGSILKISEPQGKFILKHPIQNDICMICTGTGIAPFRSMILDYFKNPENNKHQIFLFFGARKEQDILYRNELESLAKQHANFHYIVTLSQADETWKGKTGYVHPHYEELTLNLERHFYICGWDSMVRQAKNNLKDKGFSRKQINFELYD